MHHSVDRIRHPNVRGRPSAIHKRNAGRSHLLELSGNLVGLRFDPDVHVEMTMPFLLAQCVMCFRTASSQQLARAHVLNEGIFILGIPPVLILVGFCCLAYRSRNGSQIRAGRDAEMEAASAAANPLDRTTKGGVTDGKDG